MRNWVNKLVPLLLSQVLALVAVTKIKEAMVLELKPVEAAGFSLTILAGVLIFSVFILLLVRHGLVKVLSGFGYLALFLMNLSGISILISNSPFNDPLIPAIVISAVLTVLSNLKHVGDLFKCLGAGVFAACLATCFGAVFPVILLALLSVYDLWSVYKGPIKEVISRENPNGHRKHLLKPLTVRLGDVEMGIGDVLAYACMVSLTVKNLGFPLLIAPVASMYIGVVIVLWVVRRKGILPGLPIPFVFWAATYLSLLTMVGGGL